MQTKIIKIGNRLIGDKQPVFIIAEIGSNHNQNINTAKKLIDLAKLAGADAVKFQSLKYDELYFNSKSNQKTKNLFKQIELKETWYKELVHYCNKKNILFFSAATYLKAIDILEKFKVKLYKIASPQTVTSPHIIEKISKLNKPIIMSTGMCGLKEIERAVKLVKKYGSNRLSLLHCVSNYPTKADEANLGYISVLKKYFNVPVGFSDHTLGFNVTIAAVAMGADVIEKHITLSRKQKGIDHYFSLEPNEFKEMVENIRIIEKAIDRKKLHRPSKNIKMLTKIKVSIAARNNLSKEKVLNINKDIIFKRNIGGIDVWKIYGANKIILLKNIKKNQPIKESDLILN